MTDDITHAHLATSTASKQIVLSAVDELFGARDVTAIDRWFSPTYRQHSSMAPDGPEALRGLVAGLDDGFRYERARVLADGDLVALHGTYHGLGPEPLVAFDIFRVTDGRIVEHWDGLAPVVVETASGRSQVDGPTEVREPGATDRSRALVDRFAATVLVGADYGDLTAYLSTEQYDQHNPEAADGLAGFGAAAQRWAEDGKLLSYTTVHRMVVDGEFALLHSEGTFGVPVAYFDLFRVADGRIVEHWDVIAPVPATLPHSNGLF